MVEEVKDGRNELSHHDQGGYRMVAIPPVWNSTVESELGGAIGDTHNQVAMETNIEVRPREEEGSNGTRQGQCCSCCSCCTCCRQEFQLRKFGVSHPKKDLFYKSQWHWHPLIFVIYRVFLSGYLLAWLVYTAMTFPTELDFPWPVWLTNWTFLLLNIHAFLASIIAVTHLDTRWSCCRRQPVLGRVPDDPRRGAAVGGCGSGLDTDERYLTQDAAMLPQTPSEGSTPVTTTSYDYSINFDNLPDALPWFIKLDWLIFSTIANMCFIVSIIYFAVLFPTILRIHRTPPLWTDLHLHLFNSIVVLLELAISGIPIRLLHAIYPLIFGLMYIIFSAIYWAVDHDHVLYPNVLDWNSPGWTILVNFGLSVFLVPVIQLVLFGLYQLKIKIYQRIYVSHFVNSG